MTQLGRPRHDVRPWASDAAYNSPGEDWDTEPTKLRASDGEAAQGLVPDTPLSADVINHELNDLGERHRYLDGIDYQNWIEPGDGRGIIATAGNNVNGACALTWHASRRILFTNNDESAYSSEDGGYTWQVEYTSAGNDIKGCATRYENENDQTDLASAIVIQTVAPAVELRTRGVSGAGWASTMLTNGIAAHVVVADPFSGGFWVGGLATGPVKAVWHYLDVDGGSGGTQTAITGMTGVQQIDIVAVGRDYILAASSAGGEPIYRWARGASAATAIVSPVGNDILDILWDDVNETFIMIVDNGSELEVWVSADGSTGTWSQVADALDFLETGSLRGGCVRGSVVAVPGRTGAGVYYIAITTDGGQTWEFIPDPLKRHQFPVVTANVTMVRLLDRRFGAFGYAAAGEVQHALSLRTGRK